MSTTNPPNPDGMPGAGPAWPSDVVHGSAPDDSGGGGGVNPEALRAGHEPDAFYVKPILGVPFAVAVTFVIAFAVATGAFIYLMATRPDPMTHPMAAARNT